MIFDHLDAVYIPILSVRPAELIALRELPETAKDRMIPHILLRPWLGSGTLERAMDKVLHAYPNRAFTLELDDQIENVSNAELKNSIEKLRSPINGWEAWFNFVERYENVIPTLFLKGSRESFIAQIKNAMRLGRGVAVRVGKGSLALLDELEELLKKNSFFDVIFILDFEKTDERFHIDQVIALASIRKISAEVPNPRIAISSTSFPENFVGIDSQIIYERSFFKAVAQNSNRPLIYSDRGSARFPRGGGGGVPAPRIDLPSRDVWEFHRKSLPVEATRIERAAGYWEMAKVAINSDLWDPNLNIWGTQMIKLTELKSEYGINSPVKSTSARINMHLFCQSFYDYDGQTARITEDDWVD